MMDRKFMELIEQKKEELYSLLCSLIQINSENFGSHGNETDCAVYIADLCRKLGLETDLYSPLELEGFKDHPDYREGRNLENRLNVTACWKGKEDRNGLMLMGHHDTVPIGDRSLWTFEPLAGEIRDGKIWGRGACDDKYALATALFLIKLLKEQGFEPKENLLFTAYCDEESGGSHGALASALRYPAKRIVNMDCKNFEIWHCASGGGCFKYRYHVAEPVDSARQAGEAIPVVMEVLSRFGNGLREDLEQNRFYKGTVIPGTSLRYFGIRAGGNGNDLDVGELSFGIYTDRSKEDIKAQMAAMEQELSEKLGSMGIISDGFRATTRFFHYGYSEPDCVSIRELQETARIVSGRELVPCGSCLSDLSVILKYGGGEAFGFGIGRGFDVYGGAHQPDEFIACDDLVEYAKIIGAYVLKTLQD